MKHSDFMAWMVRLGRITEAKANSQINQVKASVTVTPDHPAVVAAIAEHDLSLAEISLIFKGN
ncbi:hypothetical protein [Sulfitobacter sp. SH24]|uniref:hypothetical protein n=1 Tax=Sulfitobacter sp. SH24 TaxID=3421173 RepID=UPI003F500C69